MTFNDSQTQAPSLQARMMAPKILWGAMLASTFMYLFVISTKSQTSINTDFKILSSENPLSKAFAFAALFMAISAWQIPGILRKKALQNADPFPGWFVSFIVRLAMLESISVFGLVLAILSHDINDAIPFFIVSWAGFLLSFPTADKATRALT